MWAPKHVGGRTQEFHSFVYIPNKNSLCPRSLGEFTISCLESLCVFSRSPLVLAILAFARLLHQVVSEPQRGV